MAKATHTKRALVSEMRKLRYVHEEGLDAKDSAILAADDLLDKLSGAVSSAIDRDRLVDEIDEAFMRAEDRLFAWARSKGFVSKVKVEAKVRKDGSARVKAKSKGVDLRSVFPPKEDE